MKGIKSVRPVWVEINLNALAHNMKEVKKIVKDNTLIAAVVKANAYGHGAVMASKVFLKNGADVLAVATLSEAIELRRSGIKAPIIILGYTPNYQMDEVVRYDIIQTIYNYEQGFKISNEAKKQNKKAIIHLKIDTGMSRIGFLPNENSIEEITKINELPNLKIEGIFTHFAVADKKDKSFTRTQFNRFLWVNNQLSKRGINIPVKHVSNSAAIIDLPEYNLDMVRAGIMIYGLYPSNEVNKDKIDLKPAMTLKCRISNVKTVPKGTGVSYGQIYTTKGEEKIGTIPIGYADGFTRLLTNKATVSINGKRVPVIGKICMDQSMINLTGVDNVKINDEVGIFGNGENNIPHIDEVAQALGTINYEIVCMVGRRVPRVYIMDGKVIAAEDYILGNII